MLHIYKLGYHIYIVIGTLWLLVSCLCNHQTNLNLHMLYHWYWNSLFTNIVNYMINIYIYARVVWKVLSPIQKESKKQDSFLLFFNIIPIDINALSPMMLKDCNPITKEGGILVLRKLLHSTYSLIIISKLAITLMGFKFRKQE